MKYITTSLALLLTTTPRILGQVIGEDICSCSPSAYKFKFDFDLSCPPVNVEENDAVDKTNCVITAFGDSDVTDFVPVAVQSIDVLELGQTIRIVVQERITGTFVNGDTFNYTSVAAIPEDISDPTDIPRAIQINIAATNQFDEALLSTFIITLSNDCGAYPVFVEGQSAGWVVFDELQPPRKEVCPFGSTIAPTGVPSDSPNDAISTSPTKSPTDVPTLVPSTVPTVPTTSVPTAAPTVPTVAPIVPTPEPSVETSTKAPVTEQPESSSPTLTPVSTIPTGSPSTMSMSMDYGQDIDFDSIAEEFGLLEDVRVPKAKTNYSHKVGKKDKKGKGIRTIKEGNTSPEETSDDGASDEKNSKKRRLT